MLKFPCTAGLALRMHEESKKVVLLIGILLLGSVFIACSDSDPPAKVEPAQVVDIDDSDLKQLVLQPKAVERLGIEVTAVEEEMAPGRDGGSVRARLVVPYSAIIYDPEGLTWAYVNTEENTYSREPVVIEYVANEKAFLEEGPEPGTRVVIVGAVELYGQETGVGK